MAAKHSNSFPFSRESGSTKNTFHREETLTSTSRTPPFSVAASIFDNADQLVLPITVQESREMPMTTPAEDLQRFLRAELQTPKLDQLHDYLWLAGLPLPARPLQRQRMVGRDIYITERPDEHLLWHQTKLLVKPLPDFLLCYDFWVKHLCDDLKLYRSAAGLLLSYAWLIGHRGDFVLAQEANLISRQLDWPRWAAFMKEALVNVNQHHGELVDRRYQYGELRVSRLNSMVRYLPVMWSRKNFVWGYISTSTWYQAFFERNFSWLVAVFVHVSVVLSAMQVGMSTPGLSEDRSFVNLSYGTTLFAIAVVLLGVGTMLFIWLALFMHHLISTIIFDKKVRMKRMASYGNKA